MPFQFWKGKNNLFYLLISLLIFFIVNAFLSNDAADMYVFGLFFTVVLFLSVYSLYKSRRLIYLGILLGIFSWLGYWASHWSDAGLVFIIDYALTALFFTVVTHIIIMHVMTQKVISFNTICGAICGYLLMGMVFSFLFGLIYMAAPHAFYLSDSRGIHLGYYMQSLIYFSFITLTTVGYGDITPLVPIAKTLAWMEGAAGQIYLTVLIARLVSLQVAERQGKASS